MRTQLDDLKSQLKKINTQLAKCQERGIRGNMYFDLINQQYELIDTINNIR